jgi:hypothetical protein
MSAGPEIPDVDQRLLSLGQTFGQVELANVLSNESGVIFGDPTLRLRKPLPGPMVRPESPRISLKTEMRQNYWPTHYEGGELRLLNAGDQSVDVYLRTITLTSVDGMRPWGEDPNAFQAFFTMNDFHSATRLNRPFVIPGGGNLSIPISFDYNSNFMTFINPNGEIDTVQTKPYNGVFRAAACIYTNSPATPYFWVLFEKRLTDPLLSARQSEEMAEFSLSQNYPNPFNPLTTIRYGLPSRSHVTLTVINTLGQSVATLQNGEQDAGSHDVRFDGSHLPSGVYFYRMQAGTYTETKKLLLVK